MQAHVAILVGPSLGTAKSRVLLGIDGLETRIWGVREDSSENAGADQESDEDEDEEEGAEAGNSADESESSAEEPEESDDDYDDDEDEDEDEVDDDGEDDEEGSADSDDDQPVDSPPTSQQPPPPYTSHADEQRFLQTADRLLSRTLAAADAEGSGISSEMSAPSPLLAFAMFTAHIPTQFN